MAKSRKGKKRKKHVPQRTCIGCRSVQSKRSLIRIVRSQDGVQVDPSGKVAGRGAYLHAHYSCWERGLKGSLAHALKTEITIEEHERLSEFMKTLPKDLPATEELDEQTG